eukprot:TRINITY_DN18051_c1_g2_i1.p1 TRINITY_DN18051_c1_g2~~TRINITY_DN18051_c1_g2_i1.p1  ORF type:complete len:391 (+),score=90.67 TRINITY_DN18051_c1_g2_i1:96-1268(+)
MRVRHGLLFALVFLVISRGPFASADGDATEMPVALAPEPVAALAAGGGAEAAEGERKDFVIDSKSDVMMELLNWATKHSDPEKLKEIMKKYQDNNLTIKDVYGQDVLDALFVDEANEMTQAIAQIRDFQNASVTDEDLADALIHLRDFIEQVDNAMNLHKMRGLQPLLDLGVSADRGTLVHAEALWTLGVAVQNNEPVQAELLSLDGLRRLVSQLPRCEASGTISREESSQYCAKLLFALSSLVRNQAEAQREADAQGFTAWLFDRGLRHPSRAVAKKAFGLAETILAQNSESSIVEGLSSRPDLAQAILDFMTPEEVDVDSAEKALQLLSRLLQLRPMLFGDSFRQELSAAVARIVQRCESEEMCKDVVDLAQQADTVMTAHNVVDEEL